MMLQEAKPIARHLGLTLRQVRSGAYRVNFRDGNETTAYCTDSLEDAVTTAVEMARTRDVVQAVEPLEDIERTAEWGPSALLRTASPTAENEVRTPESSAAGTCGCLSRRTKQEKQTMKTLIVALTLAMITSAASATDWQDWQCGRDLIRLSDNGLSVSGFIFRNTTLKNYDADADPDNRAEDFIVSGIDPRIRPGARFKNDKLYYRGKPCIELKHTQETK